MLQQILSQLYQDAQITLDPFTYSAIFALSGAASLLPAGGQLQSNINIQADSDFIILAQSYYCNVENAVTTATTQPVPNVQALLVDQGAGKNLYDTFVPIAAIFGNGMFPYVLPFPKMVAAKSTLSVQVQNFDAAEDYNIWLHFHGVKVYKH